MFKKKGQDIPAENENPQSSTAPRGVGVDNSNPSLSTGLSDRGSDSFLFKDRRRPEPEEEENPDKEELLKGFKPVMPSKLNPLDRQKFLSLEKQREQALQTGDKAKLEWINEEEMKILDKYDKVVQPSDELSGLNFASRKLEAREAVLSNLDEHYVDIVKEGERILNSLSVNVVRASISDSEKDYMNDIATFEVVFFIKKYGSMHIKPIIIQGYYQDGNVKIIPYFWDINGNKYSLDKAVLSSFTEEKIKYDMNKEWYEEFFDKSEVNLLSKSSSFVPLEKKIKKYASNFLFITDRVVKKIASRFNVEEDFVRLILEKEWED